MPPTRNTGLTAPRSINLAHVVLVSAFARRRGTKAVKCADDRVERCGGDVGVEADTPGGRVLGTDLDVGGGLGVRTRAERVFGEVGDFEVDAEVVVESVDERGDRSVTRSAHGAGLVGDEQFRADRRVRARGRLVVRTELDGSLGGQVFVAERGPELIGGDLGAGRLGDVLDGLGQLDLEASREFEAVFRRHDVGDTSLARLAVDPDDGVIGAPDVLGVDRQVRDGPLVVVVGVVSGRRRPWHAARRSLS